MSTPLRTRVRLNDLAELLAGIPVMLGFHPDDSLVLVTLRGKDPCWLGLTLRADLAPPELHRALVDQLLSPVRRHGADTVVLAVIGGTADPPSFRDLVERTRAALSGVDIPVAHAVWAESTHSGARWGCYDETGCGGRLPDQSSTVLAAAMTAVGSVTFGSRDELAKLLDPADEAAVTRRGNLLDQAGMNDESTSAERLVAVRAAVAEGRTPTQDEDLVRLAVALADYTVRDVCLGYALSGQAASAEQLWLDLVRALPAPERAEPAVLLAMSAYLRGNGSLANIALDKAELALPGHTMAVLLRTAIGLGLPPERMRSVVSDAVTDAELELADLGDG
jgi:predicted secreted protein